MIIDKHNAHLYIGSKVEVDISTVGGSMIYPDNNTLISFDGITWVFKSGDMGWKYKRADKTWSHEVNDVWDIDVWIKEEKI